MLQSNALDSMFSEVGTAGKPFKTRSLKCAFWRNLKRCFGSMNCWENKNINRSPTGTFCRKLKRCKMRHRFIIIEFSGPDVIFKSLIVSYTILYFENGIPYITEHNNQVQVCICSNNYKINFKLWQNNLFVQFNKKDVPKNITCRPAGGHGPSMPGRTATDKGIYSLLIPLSPIAVPPLHILFTCNIGCVISHIRYIL